MQPSRFFWANANSVGGQPASAEKINTQRASDARTRSDYWCDRQSSSWTDGKQIPIEHYLLECPGLSADPTLLLDLIYNEVLLREERGSRPSLHEYRQRFPTLDEQLVRLFDVHETISRGVVIDSPEEPEPVASDDDTKPNQPSRRSSLLPELAGYELLEPIGRGGMGMVYRARQSGTDRLVAVKIIHGGPQPSAEEVARFNVEAQASARLRHPSVVAIHEAGQRDGVHFIVMDWISGETLAEQLSRLRPNPTDSARLVRTIARAVHYAHTRHVIHRDLKPQNILLDEAGAPHIVDFGLARFHDCNATWTTGGQILGTLPYMAPEQARGDQHAVGPRVDIYGLGAVLYHMLAGQPPFADSAAPQLLARLLNDEPPPPSRLSDNVPPDLEQICLKCLHKEQDFRYATAEQLADDLTRFLDGRAVEARPLPAPVHCWRLIRRRPLVSGLVAATLLLLMLVLFGSVFAAWHFRHTGQSLAGLLDRAESAERGAKHSLFDARVLQADMSRRSGREGQRRQSLEFITSALSLRGELELQPDDQLRLRNELVAALSVMDVSRDELPGPADLDPASPIVVALSDAQRATFVPGDSTLELTSQSSLVNEPARLLTAPYPLSGPVSFSPAGDELAVVAQVAAPQLLLFDLGEPNQPPRQYGLRGKPAGELAWTPDGRFIVIASPSQQLSMLDVGTGTEQQLDPGGEFIGIRMHPRLAHLAVWNRDEIRVIDLSQFGRSAAHNRIRRLRSVERIQSIDWSPTGDHLAVGSADHCAYVFPSHDLSKPSKVLSGAQSWVNRVRFSPDGLLMAACAGEQRTRLYDLLTGQVVLLFEGLGSRFVDAGRSIEGTWTQQPARWTVERSEVDWTLPLGEYVNAANAVAVDPTSRLAVICGWDEVMLWDLSRRELVGRAAARYPVAASFLPDKRILVVDEGGLFVLSAAHDGAQIRLTRQNIGASIDIAAETSEAKPSDAGKVTQDFCPCEFPYLDTLPRLALPTTDSIAIFGFIGDEMQHLKSLRVRGPRTIARARVSPDGRLVACTSNEGGGVTVYSVSSGREVGFLETEIANPTVTFDPHSARLAIVDGRHYHIYETNQFAPILEFSFPRPSGIIGCVTFSADGRLIAVSHRRDVIDLVDARDGRFLVELPLPQNGTWLQFTPDSTALLCRDAGYQLRVWELAKLGAQLERLELAWGL